MTFTSVEKSIDVPVKNPAQKFVKKRPSTSFPHRIRRGKEEELFENCMDILKQLRINLHLIKVIK